MKTGIVMLLLLAAGQALLAQNVVQAEYFIDKDKGVGSNTLVSVTPAPDGSFPFTANLTGVPQGYHTLFIRTKDANGNWSVAARKNVEVLATTTNTITSGEYFFDADPGFGNGKLISLPAPDSLLLLNVTATLAGIAPGYHKLFIRMRDANSNWGITSRYNMEVVKDVSGGKVFLAEYFFDTDPGVGNCASVVFAEPAADGTFTFNIPHSNIPANANRLYVRAKDSSNYNWSLTSWQASSVLPVTLLSFTAQKQNHNALLQWKTANEVNVSYFNIQRSTDGIAFTTVGKIQAASNGTSQALYSYRDDISMLQAGQAYYRLQVMDKNGTAMNSSIAAIIIDKSDGRMAIYPNPAHRFFIVDHLPAESNGYITVQDLSGRALITQKLIGTSMQPVNIASLARGVYVVSIYTGDDKEVRKLVVE